MAQKIILWLGILAFTLGAAFNVYADKFESIDELTEKWISLESQRGSASAAWQEQKLIFDQQIDLYSQHEKELIETIEQGKRNRTSVDNERLELIEKQSLLESKQAIIKQQINTAHYKIKRIQNRLPPPLKLQWQKELIHFEVNDKKPGESLETLLSLLKLLHEFEARIAIHKGNITNNQGKEVMVTQIYFGIARGWYLSENGEYYGYGESSATGWTWWHNEEVNTIIPKFNRALINETLSIIKNPQKAKLTSLPVRIN